MAGVGRQHYSELEDTLQPFLWYLYGNTHIMRRNDMMENCYSIVTVIIEKNGRSLSHQLIIHWFLLGFFSKKTGVRQLRYISTKTVGKKQIDYNLLPKCNIQVITFIAFSRKYNEVITPVNRVVGLCCVCFLVGSTVFD